MGLSFQKQNQAGAVTIRVEPDSSADEPDEDDEPAPGPSNTNPPPKKKGRMDPSQPTCALEYLFGQTYAQPDTHSQATTPKDMAMDEVKKYRAEKPQPLSDNPLDWWRTRLHVYPLLSMLARNTLCIPGTSVASERVFSTAGDIVTAQRSCLTPEHVDQLLFLNKNL